MRVTALHFQTNESTYTMLPCFLNFAYKFSKQFCIASMLCLIINTATALTFAIPQDTDVIGSIDHIASKRGDTLYEIAREFDLGLLEVTSANPQINPNKRLAPGTNIVIPAAFILPPGPREGIVLNLPELRIYYYHPNDNLVTTHPVGIGRAGWLTPLGTTEIIAKRENPTWTPPSSIRHYYEKKGEILPPFIGPGPNNPLGGYAMNLGWPRYIIHGTNKPESVGLRSSSGCIRMYPEDIESLFHLAAKGTLVHVIHEPLKIGISASTVYVEAHKPLKEEYYRGQIKRNVEDKISELIHGSGENINLRRLDWNSINRSVKQRSGYPVAIGHQ